MKCCRFLMALFMLWTTAFSVVFAEEVEMFDGVKTIDLSFYSSKHFKLNNHIGKIFVGSAAIATVVQIPPTKDEFVVTAKDKEGSTTLFIWTEDGTKYEYIINVTKEQAGTAAVIERAIGLPDVHVKKVDDRVLLTGTVKNQYEKNFAIQTARLYVGGGSKASLNFGSTVDPTLETRSSKSGSSSGNTTLGEDDEVKDDGKVIDLLQMLSPTQIRLEAQVLAINPEDKKNIGFLYGTGASTTSRSPDNQGIFYLGESNVRSSTSGRSFRNNPWRWLMERHADINMSINALVTNSNAKILSRPSIMTLSGEQASIQIGGEIPYQTTSSNGVSNTEFRDYGIILQFKPIVDANNNIIATVYTEVSNMSGEAVNGQPIITTRRADAVVNLQSGSTMVVGGLMDSSEVKAVSKIPLLGDIPIIGEFFKYSSKTKNKQELVILITPYILNQEEVTHTGMTDSMKEHYYSGQREKNSLEDIDLNVPPPELPDKKRRKDSNTKSVNRPFEDSKVQK